VFNCQMMSTMMLDWLSYGAEGVARVNRGGVRGQRNYLAWDFVGVGLFQLVP
jgi:hypothetical protein